MSKSTGHAVLQNTTEFLTTDEKTFTGCSVQETTQQLTELNSLAILTLLKETGLHVTNDLTGSLLIKALTGLVLTLQQTVLPIQALRA